MIQFKTYAETLRKQTTSSFRFPTAEEVQLLASEERDKLYMSIAVMLAKNCTSYANRNLTTEAYPCVGA
jgi:hypothetical protein